MHASLFLFSFDEIIKYVDSEFLVLKEKTDNSKT